MLKCPFCHFDNEDGALFCEQCKSDLASVAPAEVAVAQVVEAMPVQAEMPMGGIVEAQVVEAQVVEAQVFEAQVFEAQVFEAAPAAVMAETSAVAVAEVSPEMPPAAPIDAPMAAAPVAAEPAPAAAPPAAAGLPIPAGAQVRLLVLRGLKRSAEYPVYDGLNFIGRADEKPVDIDLEDQEPPDRIWSSRQHAVISLENGQMNIEDLNSSNGTFVNRTRIYPGQKQPLGVNDVIQIGTVQLKVVV